MCAVSSRIQAFLQDECGAVTPEWTVLTALLVAMAASLTPITVGIHLAADVIEQTTSVPANGMITEFSE